MASNNRMDILGEARLALLTQRARIGSWETPESADVLELATLGAAQALGLDALVGSLEPGKQADLAAFSLGGMGPIHDPISAAIFSIAGARADFVSVAGKALVRGGVLVTPRAGLEQRMQSCADCLGDWLASGGEMAGVV